MASSFTLPPIHHPGPLLRSEFVGWNRFPHHLPNTPPARANRHGPVSAKFNLFEIMGGRGLCNGEEGLQKELNKSVEVEQAPQTSPVEQQGGGDGAIAVPENAFEKELMGLTGGFPGGEKGLQRFVEENPPPGKQYPENVAGVSATTSKKPKAPELPLLMPGMIAIVKNPNNPFYMYCGIVQRITDGKAGVLFEGGNWDHLITFRLDELERREKGPPMKNPKSAVLETMLQQDSK